MKEATRLIRACANSWHGIIHTVRTEAAVRTEVLVLIGAIPVAVVIADTLSHFAILIGSLLLLLMVELLNTSIERLADRVQPELDPAIKVVKDVASAAVTTAVVVAVGTWVVLLWEISRQY